MNVYHWPRQREQRNTEQANCRRSGEPPELLKPAGILELGDKLSGDSSQHDRHGEDGGGGRHCARHGGDVILPPLLLFGLQPAGARRWRPAGRRCA